MEHENNVSLNFGNLALAPNTVDAPTKSTLTDSIEVKPRRPHNQVGIHVIEGPGGFVYSVGLQNPDYLVMIEDGVHYLEEFASFGYEKRQEVCGKSYISFDGTMLRAEEVRDREHLQSLAAQHGISIQMLHTSNKNWYVIYKGD